MTIVDRRNEPKEGPLNGVKDMRPNVRSEGVIARTKEPIRKEGSQGKNTH